MHNKYLKLYQRSALENPFKKPLLETKKTQTLKSLSSVFHINPII